MKTLGEGRGVIGVVKLDGGGKGNILLKYFFPFLSVLFLLLFCGLKANFLFSRPPLTLKAKQSSGLDGRRRRHFKRYPIF